jgi:hypothetical protein
MRLTFETIIQSLEYLNHETTKRTGTPSPPPSHGSTTPNAGLLESPNRPLGKSSHPLLIASAAVRTVPVRVCSAREIAACWVASEGLIVNVTGLGASVGAGKMCGE